MNKDILTIGDVKLLVDSFYEKIKKDEVLADVFNAVIEDKWPQHLKKMYSFWQTILLNEQTYFGSPFAPHSKLPIEKEHFEKWLQLFHQTIDEDFTGEKAKEAKWRAEKMAEMFQHKIKHYEKK